MDIYKHADTGDFDNSLLPLPLHHGRVVCVSSPFPAPKSEQLQRKRKNKPFPRHESRAGRINEGGAPDRASARPAEARGEDGRQGHGGPHPVHRSDVSVARHGHCTSTSLNKS